MCIVCEANLHEMLRLVFSKKKKVLQVWPGDWRFMGWYSYYFGTRLV